MIRKTYTSTPLKITEIEEKIADTWLNLKTIWITDVGQENTYYIDEFDNEFYCKNYPQ
jgi:hypothetical protein